MKWETARKTVDSSTYKSGFEEHTESYVKGLQKLFKNETTTTAVLVIKTIIYKPY